MSMSTPRLTPLIFKSAFKIFHIKLLDLRSSFLSVVRLQFYVIFAKFEMKNLHTRGICLTNACMVLATMFPFMSVDLLFMSFSHSPRANVLHLSDGLESIGRIQWHLALCFLAAWVMVYLCVVKGVKTVGKVKPSFRSHR